jgi:glycosyltransferase involved in cell wall biosynthesis
MRITFLAPHDSFNGGVRVIALYARLLQARGHEVTIVSTPRSRPGLWEQARALRHGRWRALRRKTRPQQAHLGQAGVPQRLLRPGRAVTAADVPDADVVVATWWETAVWMAALPDSKGVKVHLVQGYESWVVPDRADQIDAALRLPNLKIAISSGLKRDIEQILGPLGMHVIPNAVDGIQFDAPARSRRQRPRVGFVYAQAPSKGADRYLRIIEHARRRLPELEVLAFGVDEVTPSMPVPAHTHYYQRPAQDALAALYADCDAWLFATRVDSFGLPILEAIACRTPVIGLPVGAAPDLLADGAGILTRPETEAHIAATMGDALVDLLQGPEASWQAMAECAYRRAHGYSWEDAVEQFEQLVARALTGTLDQAA